MEKSIQKNFLLFYCYCKKKLFLKSNPQTFILFFFFFGGVGGYENKTFGVYASIDYFKVHSIMSIFNMTGAFSINQEKFN